MYMDIHMQRAPILKSNVFLLLSITCRHTYWLYILNVKYIFFFSLGRMPTTVLGKVYSPDPDDWDNKTYVFEGHVPR